MIAYGLHYQSLASQDRSEVVQDKIAVRIFLKFLQSESVQTRIRVWLGETLTALNTHKTPKNSSWNLAGRNRLSVVTAKCLDHLYIYYDDDLGMKEADSEPNLFDFMKAAMVPWIIAVPDPVNTLFLCCLDPQLTDCDLVHELQNHGIWFYTLFPLSCIRPPLPMPICIPIWLPRYKFTPNDYHAYVQHDLPF
jgi:hypothetical protein